MVIRISGYPGAGKSTVVARLVKELGYESHTPSILFRQMAAEKGVSIEDFYKSLAEDPDVEREADHKTEELMASRDNLIVEGRVAPFLPCPFPHINILLMCDPTEAARRNLARPENAGRTVEFMRSQTEERVATERAHYKNLYHIDDHFGTAHFDLVIDTTSLTPDLVFEKVMTNLKNRA